MDVRYLYRLAITLSAALALYLVPRVANCAHGESLAEKRIEVAMRTIGHDVLMNVGDCTSRVMPIEKIDNRYQISFEHEFGFDPEDLISIVDRVMTETQFAKAVIVESRSCVTNEVVHIFEIRHLHADPIACTGRRLPKDCYEFYITIADPIQTHTTKEQTAQPITDTGLTSQSLPSNTERPTLLIYMIPLILCLGLIGYVVRRHKPVDIDPNVHKIGASLFDTKRLMLSHKNHAVALSNKEAELLTLLYASLNKTIERDVILKKVWGDEGDYVGRTVDVFISKLRKKLEADATIKIVNIRGVGYKLVDNNHS